MRKTVLVLAAAAAFWCLPAAAQTVDEIIAKHFEARGGVEKIKAVKSVRFTGRAELGPGLQAPVTMEVKRPGMSRLDLTVQGMTMVQAYDGTTGWQIVPFQGKTDPEPLSADDLKDIQEQSDSIDGPLMDYKAKGNEVELQGKEKVEGADCFKLRVKVKNGNVHTLYIDGDSFLEVKDVTKRMQNGTEVEIENTSGDYKEVDGLIFPFSFEQTIKGTPQKQRIIIEKIELNPALDDARYKMPAAAPAVPADPKPAEAKPPKG